MFDRLPTYYADLADKLLDLPVYSVLYSVGGKEALVDYLADILPLSKRGPWGRGTIAALLLTGMPLRYVAVVKQAVSAKDGARVAELLSRGGPLSGWGLHQTRRTEFAVPLTAEHFTRATRLCDTTLGEGVAFLPSLSHAVLRGGEESVELILTQFEQWSARYHGSAFFETCSRGLDILFVSWMGRGGAQEGVSSMETSVRRCLALLDQSLVLGAPLDAIVGLRMLHRVAEWSWDHPVADGALVPYLWARCVGQPGVTGGLSFAAFAPLYFGLSDSTREVFLALLSAETALPVEDLLSTAEGLSASC